MCSRRLGANWDNDTLVATIPGGVIQIGSGSGMMPLSRCEDRISHENPNIVQLYILPCNYANSVAEMFSRGFSDGEGTCVSGTFSLRLDPGSVRRGGFPDLLSKFTGYVA